MLQAPETLRQSLSALIDNLDHAAERNDASPGPRNRRVRQRRSFRTECTVKCFPSGGPMETLGGVTRNISYRGVSLLVQVELICGQPVEIQIDLPDQETTYVAGVVAFCRQLPDGYYEVGFQVQAAGPNPAFHEPPAAETATQEWLAEALTTVNQ